MKYSYLERTSIIIVAGGFEVSDVEVLIGGHETTKQLPNLPEDIDASSMVLHNGNILLCGGWDNMKECLVLKHGTWEKHSTLNEERDQHSAVATPNGSFIFGGNTDYDRYDSRHLYEYLPKDSSTWLTGKYTIPETFHDGFAIASEQDVWLIGMDWNQGTILKFNINDHKFQELPSQLYWGRIGHKAAFIPHTKKIMVTGGLNFKREFLNSTEIFDTEDGHVTMASPMNSKRRNHGIGVITIDNEDRLAVFGGHDGQNMLDSVELYNTQTEKWETTNIKLKEAKDEFGFLSLKLSDILSKI